MSLNLISGLVFGGCALAAVINQPLRFQKQPGNMDAFTFLYAGFSSHITADYLVNTQ